MPRPDSGTPDRHPAPDEHAVVVGRIADRAKDWRSVIVIGSLVAGVIPVGLFFVNEFWGILLVWTLAALPNSAVNPVVDAATMRMTRRRGTDYGTIRAWGTVGYMVINASTGFAIAAFGTAAFVPIFVALSLLRASTALGLPQFRSPEPQATLAESVPVAGKARELLKPWFVLPIFGLAPSAYSQSTAVPVCPSPHRTAMTCSSQDFRPVRALVCPGRQVTDTTVACTCRARRS